MASKIYSHLINFYFSGSEFNVWYFLLSSNPLLWGPLCFSFIEKSKPFSPQWFLSLIFCFPSWSPVSFVIGLSFLCVWVFIFSDYNTNIPLMSDLVNRHDALQIWGWVSPHSLLDSCRCILCSDLSRMSSYLPVPPAYSSLWVLFVSVF